MNPQRPERSAIRLPERLAARARDVLEGRCVPVFPRDAATVMLVRPAARARRGVEVYMLRRTSSMAFAAGAFVFPGGTVDARDFDKSMEWAVASHLDWAESLAEPLDVARALACAAVRETFEESGVLLAGPSADRLVADTTAGDWVDDRHRLLDRSISLAALLARHRLTLRADLLRPWSRWVTPVIEERRYDTRFFVAAMPRGQRTSYVDGEASADAWVRPEDAVEAGRRGDILLYPPTAVTLTELAACASVAEALARPAATSPRLPDVRLSEGAAWLCVPGFETYLPT